jgi:hypothetical protein
MAQYGGLATSAYPIAPADLDSGNNLFRIRPKPGRELNVEYMAVQSSETILKYDLLSVTQASNSDEVHRALDPAGSAGANLAGDSGTVPHYIALADNTSGASQTELDTIPVYSLYECQLLVRVYHSTAGSSDNEAVRVNMRPQIPVGGTALNTDFYGWGYWEIGTNSDNYFLILDATNLDGTNGSLAAVEAAEFASDDNFGAYWCEFTGLA